MNVEVYLTPIAAADEDLRDVAVIVVDVLRACSTIVTALQNGARAIVPVADMAEAGKIAANLDHSTTVTGGERGGRRIEGYNLGNSPHEYTTDAVQGRTVVLKTSNGTGTIAQARGAAMLTVGCFLNASRVIEFARNAERDVAIICAGYENQIALEDALFAGMVVHELWDGRERLGCSDAAHIAFSQYLHDRHDLQRAIMRSNHAQRLFALDFGDDVAYCSQIDAVPVLPIFRDLRLTLAEPRSSAAQAPSEAESRAAER
jgi:2-phosphosulfolactate phosphatase